VVCRVGLANGKRAAWWLTVASLDRSPSIWQGYTAGTRPHICLIKVIPHSSAANQPFPDLAHTPRLHPFGPASSRHGSRGRREEDSSPFPLSSLLSGRRDEKAGTCDSGDDILESRPPSADIRALWMSNIGSLPRLRVPERAVSSP
jgi:hypothetical protein